MYYWRTASSLRLLHTSKYMQQCRAPEKGTMHVENTRKENWLEEAILYVHWPYCQKKCTYCNFNKYVIPSIDQERMKKCLARETESLLHLSNVKKIKSIFFGGGTPSLADPEIINEVVSTVKKHATLVENAEITLEANPTSTEASKLSAFKAAGVNRLSLGVQSMRDQDLQQLGRQHSVDDAMRCLEICKDLFAGRTSIDIIFGRPQQSLEDWKEELKEVMAVCDDHLSLYQLTLERGTELFKQVMDRKLYMPSPDIMGDIYQHTVQTMEEHGYHRYEVSNFARCEGAESVHNKGYWESCQYLGVGPGAHGRFVPQSSGSTCREARVQTLVPDTWMNQVEKFGHGTQKAVAQSQIDILQEVLMVALRTKHGLREQMCSSHSKRTQLCGWYHKRAVEYIKNVL